MAPQIKNLSGNNVPEYKVQEQRQSRFILVHYGIFKIGWDWLLLLCTFYIAVTVPFNAAFVTFMADGFNQRNSIVSDVIVEMLFIIGQRLSPISVFLSFSFSASVCCSANRFRLVTTGPRCCCLDKQRLLLFPQTTNKICIICMCVINLIANIEIKIYCVSRGVNALERASNIGVLPLS